MSCHGTAADAHGGAASATRSASRCLPIPTQSARCFLWSQPLVWVCSTPPASCPDTPRAARTSRGGTRGCRTGSRASSPPPTPRCPGLDSFSQTCQATHPPPRLGLLVAQSPRRCPRRALSPRPGSPDCDSLHAWLQHGIQNPCNLACTWTRACLPACPFDCSCLRTSSGRSRPIRPIGLPGRSRGWGPAWRRQGSARQARGECIERAAATQGVQ